MVNRSRLLGAVRTHLVAMAPEARDYSGHYLLHSPLSDDKQCPNCRSDISKAFDIPTSEHLDHTLRCAYCRVCETFTVWPAP